MPPLELAPGLTDLGYADSVEAARALVRRSFGLKRVPQMFRLKRPELETEVVRHAYHHSVLGQSVYAWHQDVRGQSFYLVVWADTRPTEVRPLRGETDPLRIERDDPIPLQAKHVYSIDNHVYEHRTPASVKTDPERVFARWYVTAEKRFMGWPVM